MNRTPRTDARSFRATTARLLTLLLALTLAASACTSGSGSEGAAPTITTTDDDPTETGRGWLDGSPADADASFGGGDEEAMATAEGDMAMTTTMASGGEAAESADGARVVMEEPIDAGPPRAGSIDDNESFQDYLAYLERIAGLGLPVRAVDVSTQHRVVVTGTNGLPVAGLPVVVRQGDVEIGSVRTGADGIALLHPSAMAGWDGAGQLVAVASGVEVALDAPTV
ncbi:MAG: hypothetical protein R2710_29570, partial [Acidimicrobiales bacterium]